MNTLLGIILFLCGVNLVYGQTVANCRPVGIPGCSATAQPGQPTYCCPNSYCNAAITCISCINATNTAACSGGQVEDETRCCPGLTCSNGRCVSATATPSPAAPTPIPPAPVPPSAVVASDPANCSPLGTVGCNPAAQPGQIGYCCPSVSYCNDALTCMSCINASNTATCSTGNVQNSSRCCNGLTCVNGRCVVATAPTPSPPTAVPPTVVPPATNPSPAVIAADPANCIPVGTVGCNPGASAGQNLYCCPSVSYCNAALTCIACINATNTSTCSAGNVQDSTKCCPGLTCVNGRCVGPSTTTVVPPTGPSTVVPPTAAPTSAPVTDPPNCSPVGTVGCNPNAFPGQIGYCCPSVSFCNTALTCISCINATNTATCSATDTEGPTRCCTGLNCVNGRCMSTIPTSTVTVVSQTTCLGIGAGCTVSDSCCTNLLCQMGFCLPRIASGK